MPSQNAGPAEQHTGPRVLFIPGTNAIESLNARFRRSVKARGHFPTEQAALKHLYLVILSLDPTGQGRKRELVRGRSSSWTVTGIRSELTTAGLAVFAKSRPRRAVADAPPAQ
jgi:hypothetical protein